MELRVESAEGFTVPPGCFVGVRVGDVLKQGRYEPQRCYHFPAMERRRNAKIDIYRHVGSCVVAVDPEAKSFHEVNVASTDTSVQEMKLKVSVQSTTADAGKQREARTKAVKNQAKDYLSKYQIEEKLSEAVKALLKEQPTNPTDFLCRHLMGADGMSLADSTATLAQARRPEASPTAPVDSKPKTTLPAGKPGPVAMKPFKQYYADSLKFGSCGDAFCSNLYAKFPAAPRATTAALPPTDAKKDMMQLRQQARDVLMSAASTGELATVLKDVRHGSEATSTVSTTKRGFTLKPSVATWLASSPPKPLKVPVWNKLPSVGTWLAPAPQVELEERRPQCMMGSNMLIGPQFYSLGLPNMVRVI